MGTDGRGGVRIREKKGDTRLWFASWFVACDKVKRGGNNSKTQKQKKRVSFVILCDFVIACFDWNVR